MQSEVISRRPVYKEDIILLAMKLGQFSRDILSSVSDRNQIHLMIFSTEEGRNACMKKVDAVAQEFISCLNPVDGEAFVKVWYFPGRFRQQASEGDLDENGVLEPFLSPATYVGKFRQRSCAIGVPGSNNSPAHPAFLTHHPRPTRTGHPNRLDAEQLQPAQGEVLPSSQLSRLVGTKRSSGQLRPRSW